VLPFVKMHRLRRCDQVAPGRRHDARGDRGAAARILVPYPFAAHDHQRVNAANLADRGAAVVIEDGELTGERLAQEIAHLLSDRTTLSRMSANARLFARPDAAARLARSLVAWAEGKANGDAHEPAMEEGN
jgi:hypothetical protein